MAKLSEIVIDSIHPASLARFWAATLDDYWIRDYDQQEINRLASQGLTPETDPSVALDGSGPTWFFQKTAAPKTDRNRIHFDVICDDRESEITRLTALGARVRSHHASYSVLLDPEDNEFCVKKAE